MTHTAVCSNRQCSGERGHRTEQSSKMRRGEWRSRSMPMPHDTSTGASFFFFLTWYLGGTCQAKMSPSVEQLYK